MRAFVLSGGGNQGPLQVGAIRALLDWGVAPEMVIGCSAGALNAAFLARGTSPPHLDGLATVWRNVTQNDVYPGSRLSAVCRILCRQDSFFDNRNFYAFLQRNGVTPAHTFGSTDHVRLFVTATQLAGGRLHVFGDDPGDRVLDALMASTALPPFHPPWEVDGQHYVDGGTVTPLPLRVALDRGADEIYALHIRNTEPASRGLVRGILNVMGHSVSTMLNLQADHDLLLTEVAPKVRLHYIRLWIPSPPGIFDWSQSDRMVEHGYHVAEAYMSRFARRYPPAQARSRASWAQIGRRLNPTWAKLFAPRHRSSGLSGEEHSSRPANL